MSILQKLTEGVQSRDMQAEGAALLNKWEATGLLEGLNEGQAKQGMAVLLENQAKELLREASSMAAGDVEGFAAVAFPIVRRVFGGLIANDLISVQPMSLPSGLIFFLDFTHEGTRGGFAAGDSLYGGGVVGKGIVDGVDEERLDESGFYGLRSGYAAAHAQITISNVAGVTQVSSPGNNKDLDYDVDIADTDNIFLFQPTAAEAGGKSALAQIDPGAPRAISFPDQDMDSGGTSVGTSVIVRNAIADEASGLVKRGDVLVSYAGEHNTTPDPLGSGAATAKNTTVAVFRPIRRLTDFATETSSEGLKVLTKVSKFVWQLKSIHANASALTGGDAAAILAAHKAQTADDVAGSVTSVNSVTIENTELTAVLARLKELDLKVDFPVRDDINAVGLGALQAGAMPLEEPVGHTGNTSADNGPAAAARSTKNEIAEIDIKVDSLAVTAQTKKLKAKWSPELGQDLNAYHNLDAEVELTGILSEQIALEIDRELLGELVDGATAGTRYWSRAPGLFVDSTGAELGARSAAPDFTGTVSEWYETLIETINDVSAQIHRKTLRGGANFVVCSPEVANILEFTSGFRASVTADQDRGTIGAVRAGSLSKKFDVYVDPYFLRNVLLVGRKGSSFLESGYVYAPYVPLQVTPTIFGTEDFVPRKGVMTRYAKKMVRPDMYGLVIVRGLLGESGS